MGFFNDVQNNLGNFVGNTGAIITRDAGHAINGGFNAVGLGQYNPGSVLVDASHQSGYNPKPMWDIGNKVLPPPKNVVLHPNLHLIINYHVLVIKAY